MFLTERTFFGHLLHDGSDHYFTETLAILAFVHFHTCSSSREHRGAAALGVLEAHGGVQQPLTGVLTTHQDGRCKHVWRCKHSTLGPWSTTGTLSRGCSRQALRTNLSWGILVTWSNHRSWDLYIWRRSGSTFRALQISRLGREMSRPELFAKIISLPLEIVVFQSVPKILDHRWGSKQKPI